VRRGDDDEDESAQSAGRIATVHQSSPLDVVPELRRRPEEDTSVRLSSNQRQLQDGNSWRMRERGVPFYAETARIQDIMQLSSVVDGDSRGISLQSPAT
jgi:hypothetical protein